MLQTVSEAPKDFGFLPRSTAAGLDGAKTVRLFVLYALKRALTFGGGRVSLSGDGASSRA